jgi:pimeloyl-ACP methyl ester carboxylesterase
MTAVFVHGVPETPAVWEPLFAELGRADVVALRLPGFGVDAPAGFGATKEEYVEWLVAELETIAAADGPVDLVGHDWGGGFVARVAAQRPDLLHSWASDVLGLFHPDYVWHAPGAGEAFFESQMALPAADQIAFYETVGIPAATGARFVEAAGSEMGRCILALYRSAAQPAMAEWGTELGGAAARPGLAIIAPDDPFVRSTDFATVVAAQTHAAIGEISGQGHWWMLGDPAAGAELLTEFWAGLS